MLKLGISPRGTLALTQIAKGIALAMGRSYVIPDDVIFICHDVFAHRIILNSKAKLSERTADDIIQEIIKNTPAPKISAPTR